MAEQVFRQGISIGSTASYKFPQIKGASGNTLILLDDNGNLGWGAGSGGGGSQTLSQTLVLGNNTGGTNIALGVSPLSGDSDIIVSSLNSFDYAGFSFEEGDVGFWSPIIKTIEGDRTNRLIINKTNTQLYNSRVGGFINKSSTFTINETSIVLTSDDLAAGEGTTFTINSTSAQIQGSTNFQGIQYNTDYSANYTLRSLVDKEYVDNQVGSPLGLGDTLAIANATNGNSILLSNDWTVPSADSIKPYSNSITSEFSFDYGGLLNNPGTHKWYPKILSTSSSNQSKIVVGHDLLHMESSNILFLGGPRNIFSDINLTPAEISISTTDVTNSSGITHIITSTSHTVSSDYSLFRGISYENNYSANFNNRSLVDKEYVDTSSSSVSSMIPKVVHQLACSDETTSIASGNSKVTFRLPYAMTLQEVRASLTTAQASGNIFTVDVRVNGSSILSTKITIDNTEKTSKTAAIPTVISNTSLADDAEVTIDVIQVGDGTAKGLKVSLIGILPL